jgi:hypothetical protein
LTGDLKKISYGVVSYSMQGMNTISIDEVVISSIKSKKQFEIKLTNDSIYYGSFDTARLKQMCYIVMDSSRKLVNMRDIVEVFPLKRNFWLRTSGNFNIGFNFTKASNIGSLSLSGNLSYRKRKSFFNLYWSDNNTWQADTLTSSTADAGIQWQRYLKKKWSLGFGLSIGQNSELGTKQRIGFSSVAIRDLVYNNWNRFFASAGFSTFWELDYSNPEYSNSITGLIGVGWRVYKLTEPKVNITSNIMWLPYLGNNRNRVNININPSISMLSDNFKFGIEFYTNYDSKPPSDAYSTLDYGINLTLGYSFH